MVKVSWANSGKCRKSAQRLNHTAANTHQIQVSRDGGLIIPTKTDECVSKEINSTNKYRVKTASLVDTIIMTENYLSTTVNAMALGANYELLQPVRLKLQKAPALAAHSVDRPSTILFRHRQLCMHHFQHLFHLLNLQTQTSKSLH